MQTSSLETRYRSRQVNERLQRADKRLIIENRRAQLLIEAMNDQDLQKASTIIDKLRKIKGKGVKTLDGAIGEAETQLNKYTGGGPLDKAWSKLKGIVGFDNPLVKFMTFSNALENGFRQMPTIIKNNVDADLNANLDKTLAQLVPDPDKQKVVTDNMLKALSPRGFFGAFKKIPYVDKQALVQDLMNIPLKVFADVTRAVNQGPNSDQVATDLKDTATETGGPGTKGTTGETPAVGTTGTTGSGPAKNTTGTSQTAAVGETPERDPTKIADKIYQQLNVQLHDAVGDERKARAVLKLLADEGKLKA